MPPRRPLPDLDLISVFKMLTPNEQLVASKMSPRCAVLVRAANRRVKTLVINRNVIKKVYLSKLRYTVDSFYLASKSSMQQLMDIPGETFPDYPMTTRLSKWNCLMIQSNGFCCFDAETIEQIVTIFSAVTDLKFITFSSGHIDTLVSLLQHPNWQCQLTNLTVNGTRGMYSQLAGELIPAINGLTALQLLVLEWSTKIDVPDLSILAQLKTVVFKSYTLDAFLRSLERNAANNADLEVHLLSDNTQDLLTLSQPLRSRIVRFGRDPLDYTIDQVSLLCSQFRSLTSLEIENSHIESTEVRQLFSHLSQLHQLIYLAIEINLSEVKEARPLARLNSVRALDLDLRITSHSQVEWLNLRWTMPNLQTIQISVFNCGSCQLQFGDEELYAEIDSPEYLDCFGASLFNLHPGVHLKRFILLSGEESFSAEELLLQSQMRTSHPPPASVDKRIP